jgi:hypothetical protein
MAIYWKNLVKGDLSLTSTTIGGTPRGVSKGSTLINSLHCVQDVPLGGGATKECESRPLHKGTVTLQSPIDHRHSVLIFFDAGIFVGSFQIPLLILIECVLLPLLRFKWGGQQPDSCQSTRILSNG